MDFMAMLLDDSEESQKTLKMIKLGVVKIVTLVSDGLTVFVESDEAKKIVFALATLNKSYFEALKGNGFTDAQAFQLLCFQNQAFAQVLKKK